MLKLELYVDCDEVRNYCIRNRYFTAGNNQQYEAMFEYVKKYNKTQDLKALENAAVLIVNHTTEEELEIDSVMFDLLNTCGCADIVRR